MRLVRGASGPMADAASQGCGTIPWNPTKQTTIARLAFIFVRDVMADRACTFDVPRCF
ncbi:hypothetical protein [Arthrobacter agilis]|uniref:hypothetical protein n=1 Tax=Arthrobacter agilis TaxID=37921 RepID=UPI001EFE0989|nr:hypothetical protein [Arthrobacter agilis]